MNRTVLIALIGLALGGLVVLFIGGELLGSDPVEDEDLYSGVDGDGEFIDVDDGGGLTATGDGGAAERAKAEAEQRRREEEARRGAFDASEGVSGTVTDGAGKPIARATVTLAQAPDRYRQWAPLPAALATAMTNELGQFLVGPAPTGKRLILRAEAAGYAPSSQPVEQRGARVDLILDLGGRLDVRVLDMKGTPVVGAKVMHTVGWWWQSVVSEAQTDEGGVARFLSVPTGTGNLVVAAAGHAAVRQNDVAVAPGEKAERTVILDEGQQISGVVKEESSDLPIEGAQVEVHYPNFGIVEPSKASITDGQGAFRVMVDIAAGEQYELRVRHSNYAEARVSRNLNASDEIVVKLSEASEGLRGTVFGPDRRGAAGVRVAYYGLQGDKLPEATTNEMGDFTLPAPPWKVNGASILAVSPKHGIASRYVRFNTKQPMPEIRLTLPGAGDLEGTVLGKNGEPVQGALVTIEPDVRATNEMMGPGQNAWQIMNLMRSGSNLNYSGVSDADGRFLIRGVPAMAYRVKARFGKEQARTEEPVLVQAGITANAEVTLQAGGTIEGYVVDSDERAVAGAYVYARPMDRRGQGWGMSQPNARSQSDGHFVLHGIEDYDYTVHVSASGYGAASDKNITKGTTDLTLRLAKQGWIKGVVMDVRGGPYRGTFRIHVSRVREGSGPENFMWANNNTQIFNTDDGEFEIRGRTAGKYEVRASTTDGLISLQKEVVDVVDGRGAREVRLQLSRGSVLRGRVTDESSGKPIKNAYVYVNARKGEGGQDQSGATSGNSRTNAKGEYEIKGLGAGAYTVNVWADGANWSTTADLGPGETKTVDLTKRQPGSIRITVVDKDGNPLKGAYPNVRSTTGAIVQPNWQQLRKDGVLGNSPNAWQEATTTGDDGVNVRYHVPPGRYRITANLKGYVVDGEGPWVEVLAGNQSSAEVRLKKAESSN
ncbi:MAG: carboxypeptidase regulatory-like domain-containing protein [Planctomycetota bacterium]|nr:carboxypeptidase regulatory-like domain-containing protein [Planctomycetota bacterium]